MSEQGHPDTVLIVDDQQPMRLLLGGILRNLRFANIQQSASGRKAMELARIRRPDILFLDLMMPDMHGLDVLEQLRALEGGDRTFVVVQTGSATKDNVERAVELGVGAILVKPYSVDKVNKALGQYLEWRRNASAG